jgi:hypothetical protein
MRLAPESARLTPCYLGKAPAVKRHHFTPLMIMFMATVLQQAGKDRPVNATLLCPDACVSRQRAVEMSCLPLHQ